MRKLPILFNTEMVRAILDGRKTQTRRSAMHHDEIRPFKCSQYPDGWWMNGRVYKTFESMFCDIRRKAKFKVGDILWVRETWGKLTECDVFPSYEPHEERFIYRADIGDPDHFQAKWHPSIHMPREAARIFLCVKNVLVERLQDITEDDVCAEGAEPLIVCDHEHPLIGTDGAYYDMCYNDVPCLNCPIDRSYGELFGEMVWNPTIKKVDLPVYGWDANPWVWVIEFNIEHIEGRKWVEAP